jgi:hypothetical protein
MFEQHRRRDRRMQVAVRQHVPSMCLRVSGGRSNHHGLSWPPTAGWLGPMSRISPCHLRAARWQIDEARAVPQFEIGGPVADVRCIVQRAIAMEFQPRHRARGGSAGALIAVPAWQHSSARLPTLRLSEPRQRAAAPSSGATCAAAPPRRRACDKPPRTRQRSPTS